MKHLEESNKEAREDAEMDAEIEMEMSRALTPIVGACPPTPDGRGIGGGQNPAKKELPVLLKQARVNCLHLILPYYWVGLKEMVEGLKGAFHFH